MFHFLKKIIWGPNFKKERKKEKKKKTILVKLFHQKVVFVWLLQIIAVSNSFLFLARIFVFLECLHFNAGRHTYLKKKYVRRNELRTLSSFVEFWLSWFWLLFVSATPIFVFLGLHRLIVKYYEIWMMNPETIGLDVATYRSSW